MGECGGWERKVDPTVGIKHTPVVSQRCEERGHIYTVCWELGPQVRGAWCPASGTVLGRS